MTTIHGLATHWLVRSFGWTLFHFCWQGALLALLLWCILQLLARGSAQQRYVAACVALSLMILLPLVTFIRIATHEYALAAQFKIAAIPMDSLLALETDSGPSPWLAGVVAALDHLVPWVPMLWFAGVIVSLIRLTVGLELARRMKVFGIAQVSPSLQKTFDSLRQRLDLSRPISLMSSVLVQVPTVVGWLRPVVLIPVTCFTGLTDIQIEAILCHELAHIRRHDYLVSIIQSLVEAFLFYHPAVWWVSRQVRRERECCCDDLAVTFAGDALAYAKALAALEVKRSFYPEVVLGSNGGVLTMRIKRLLQSEEVSALPQVAAVSVLFLFTVAAGVVVGTARAETRAHCRRAGHSGGAHPACSAASCRTDRFRRKDHLLCAPFEAGDAVRNLCFAPAGTS